METSTENTAKILETERPFSEISSTAGAIERARTVLREIGFSEGGLDRLNLKSMQQLTDLIMHGEKRGAVVLKIFNAVSETNPQRLEEVIGKLAVYTGSFPILSHFLECVGHRDPFLATSRAQLLILPADDLPTTRGVSGHVLKGLTYCAYAPDAPAESVGYFSKKQAITKIFEAFNPERMTADTKERVRQRRQSTLKDELRNITLTELESSSTALSEIGSPLLARNMEVYRELRAAIEQCHERLSELVYAGEVVISGLKSFKVGEDPGRQFFGWFEEHLSENKNVPRGIVLAYQSLKDPDIHLTEAEERNYLRGLLSYQRLHSYINKAVALGGLQKDLDEYNKLGLQDPLRLDEAVHQARIQIQNFAAEGSNEINLSEFSRMLELSGMVAFRRSMNQRLVDIYGEHLKNALERFEFVSFKDGKWRDDALEDSVPMDRLKAHLYGARVGSADPHHLDKKQAVLTQRDFRAIADYQFLTRLVTDHEKLLASMPVSDFRQMIHGVIVADRKAAFLEKQLSDFMQTPKGAAIQLDRENLGESLKDWSPRLIIGRYLPVEIERERAFGDGEVGLGLQEIARRTVARAQTLIPYRAPLRRDYDRQRFDIENALPQGLYTEESELVLKGIRRSASALISSSDCADELERAARLFAHPMVVNSGYVVSDALKHTYLYPAELASIREYLGAEQTILEASVGYDSEIAAIGSRLREINHARILTGSVVGEAGRQRLVLADGTFSDFAERKIVQLANSRVEYFKPDRVVQALETIERDYVKVETLESSWFSHVATLCSYKGRAALSRAGFDVVDTPTFNAARTIRSYGNTYISREFVDRINAIAAMR